MPAALFVIAALIYGAPLVLIFAEPFLEGATAATSGIALALVTVNLSGHAAANLWLLSRTFLILAAVPALWTILQILPLDLTGIAHPIWASAEQALRRPLAGSTSIDIGSSLIALGQYLSAISLFIATAAIGMDRQRAAWVVRHVILSATILILAAIFGRLGNNWGNPHLSELPVTTVAAVGATAAAIMFAWGIARAESVFDHVMNVGIMVAALVCLGALLVLTPLNMLTAVLYALVPLASILLIRRFQLGLWGVYALGAVALVMGVALFALHPRFEGTDITLAFASSDASLVSLAQRVLADSSWAGSGAGTATDLIPIYQMESNLQVAPEIPTAAAKMVIELGRPMALLALLMGLAYTARLAHGALVRRRDWIYPAMGAGCACILILLAFKNCELVSPTTWISSVAILGIATAQRKDLRG